MTQMVNQVLLIPVAPLFNFTSFVRREALHVSFEAQRAYTKKLFLVWTKYTNELVGSKRQK